MKNTFKYIAALVALLSGFSVYAQNLETLKEPYSTMMGPTPSSWKHS